MLQLPRSTNIAGPSQVASNFEAKPAVANSLSLLRQGGSDVVLGNLLTLPVGGGLLYVQPVYVRATSNSASYPLLQKVLVSFGDQIGFDDTLKGALDQVFGGNSGTSGTAPTSPSTGFIFIGWNEIIRHRKRIGQLPSRRSKMAKLL